MWQKGQRETQGKKKPKPTKMHQREPVHVLVLVQAVSHLARDFHLPEPVSDSVKWGLNETLHVVRPVAGPG